MKQFFLVFVTVFLAELGDKTQLATMMFSTGKEVNRWTVFFASSVALVLCSALGVLAGGYLGKLINPRWITVLSGVVFTVIGIALIVSSFRTAA